MPASCECVAGAVATALRDDIALIFQEAVGGGGGGGVVDRGAVDSCSASPPPLLLQPRDFFVAFGGVLCVAFEGFPLWVEVLKQQLEDRRSAAVATMSGMPECACDVTRAFASIEDEAMGSRWSKCTLAALTRPEPRGETSTPARLPGEEEEDAAVAALRNLCIAFRGRIRKTTVAAGALKVIHFGDRSLSCRKQVVDVPIPSTSCPNSLAAVSDAMQQRTTGVLSSFFAPVQSGAFEAYVRQDVAARLVHPTHYTAPAEGVTLVADLGDEQRIGSGNEEFHQVLSEFRSAVDALLASGVEGGRGAFEYEWLPHVSLHCTIRGLL